MCNGLMFLEMHVSDVILIAEPNYVWVVGSLAILNVVGVLLCFFLQWVVKKSREIFFKALSLTQKIG